jgi:hypothetical protein
VADLDGSWEAAYSTEKIGLVQGKKESLKKVEEENQVNRSEKAQTIGLQQLISLDKINLNGPGK